MNNKQFFDEITEQSAIKVQIVSKYFWAWAKVIMPIAKKFEGKIAYIDLFAGPGRYKDGTMSTPLLVLETAIKDDDMRRMLVAIFNDADSNNARSLETAINSLNGIKSLRYAPQVFAKDVDTEIVKIFNQVKSVPKFFFVDPWGYKGLSLKLLKSILQSWGCDCIFFFNYNRINMGLSNPMIEIHMNALFGEQRANDLRQRLDALEPREKELTIIEELVTALKEMGGEYVLPFGFKNDRGTRTSHHLIFVSKHFRGYEIMKEIMAGESSRVDQGIASFEYSPADYRQPLQYELFHQQNSLEEMLLIDFAGRCVTLEQVYQLHNVGKPYIERNYRDALRNLEAEGRIIGEPPATKRMKIKSEVTLGPKVRFYFP